MTIRLAARRSVLNGHMFILPFSRALFILLADEDDDNNDDDTAVTEDALIKPWFARPLEGVRDRFQLCPLLLLFTFSPQSFPKTLLLLLLLLILVAPPPLPPPTTTTPARLPTPPAAMIEDDDEGCDNINEESLLFAILSEDADDDNDVMWAVASGLLKVQLASTCSI